MIAKNINIVPSRNVILTCVLWSAIRKEMREALLFLECFVTTGFTSRGRREKEFVHGEEEITEEACFST